MSDSGRSRGYGASRLKPPLHASDHLRGGELSAPFQLVEFGDFECPFCGEAAPMVGELLEAFGPRLVFAFRQFPVVGNHPHALIAAEAAEAAAAQGRFWEMHDLLYSHQDALEVPHLQRYAELIGLDGDQFLRDLRSHRFLEKVRADLHSGAVSGVNGTPTFFIGGARYDGDFELDQMHQALVTASGAESFT